MYKEDETKEKLYRGLVEHYPDVPRWILCRTVELARTPGTAFDAIYEFKISNMPVSWDFEAQRWKKEKVVLH